MEKPLWHPSRIGWLGSDFLVKVLSAKLFQYGVEEAAFLPVLKRVSDRYCASKHVLMRTRSKSISIG